MDVDPSKIKALPVSTTLLLVNQFITQTTVFLNSFSEAMEKKISKVSSRVTELEILMSVFEAKLNSIPTSGVEFSAESLPDAAPAPAPASAPLPDLPDTSAESQAPPVAAAEVPVEVPVQAPPAPAGPMVKDHPEYSKYFKMLKVGVPQVVIEGKMRENGLDPSLLETPDAPAPGGDVAADAGDID